jgi:DNA modification methylase
MPEPYWSDGEVTLHLGDCLDVLREMPDCSVDAVVTDPPYGLAELSAALVLQAIAAWMAGDRTHVPDGRGFMGKEWDGFVPPPGAWDECMRVLKPGGHLLSFAGSRTVDLMMLSIRIAGFEIRDSIEWIYAGGMPKSHDVSKAIDKAAGAGREVVGQRPRTSARMLPGQGVSGLRQAGGFAGEYAEGERVAVPLTAPATEDAARWEGWGTGLRPSHEPVIVARKPLEGTVAANVLKHGTGGINIDGCKIGTGQRVNHAGGASSLQRVSRVEQGYRPTVTVPRNEDADVAGRWPANVVFTHSAACEMTGTRPVRSDGHHPASRGPGGLSTTGHSGQRGLDERKSGTEEVGDWSCAADCPVAELDRQSGVLTSGANPERRGSDEFRDAYGEFAGQVACISQRGADAGGASRFFPAFRWQAKAPSSERPRLEDGTAHSTVKPLELMRYLVRLVTPPGGTVADPFAGSGTTGEACVIEGFRCVLIEKDPSSAELIKTRLRKDIQPVLFGEAS